MSRHRASGYYTIQNYHHHIDNGGISVYVRQYFDDDGNWTEDLQLVTEIDSHGHIQGSVSGQINKEGLRKIAERLLLAAKE